jgi:hypothetical protein
MEPVWRGPPVQSSVYFPPSRASIPAAAAGRRTIQLGSVIAPKTFSIGA